MRLRAGVARVPDPYEVLFSDITEAGDPVYYGADYDPERVSFSGGLGFLFQESLAIDAAYVTGGFTREGGRLSEEVDERRLLLTAGFRLD